MYGGSHYVMSAAADMTPQGRAILSAARRFGDGRSNTLPFAPCKRYYNPYSESDGSGKRVRMYACRLHHELRKKRVTKEGGRWRDGEKHLDDFWSDSDECDGMHEKKTADQGIPAKTNNEVQTTKSKSVLLSSKEVKKEHGSLQSNALEKLPASKPCIPEKVASQKFNDSK